MRSMTWSISAWCGRWLEDDDHVRDLLFRRWLRGGQGRQFTQEAVVLLGQADGHPQPVGVAVTAHRADDDPPGEQGPVDLPGPSAHPTRMKLAWQGTYSSPAAANAVSSRRRSLRQRDDHPARCVLVGQRRQGGHLGQQVDVERLADLVERGHDRRRGDAEADPQPGQAVRLGEGPQHDQVVAPAGEHRQRVGVRAEVDVLVVGLVDDDQHLGGDVGQEAAELAGARRRSRSGCSGWPRRRPVVRSVTARAMAARSWVCFFIGTCTARPPMARVDRS